MSPYTPPLNPSQTVERIREIIVGRHLERLEQRVAMLETGVPPTSAAAPALDQRFSPTHETLAALKDNVERLMESNRQQTELRLSQYREETQRLAVQIQQVATMKASEPAPRSISQLENRLGTWLTDWQSSINVHLHERDIRIASQLRSEVGELWARTESQLARLESQSVGRDSLDERFHRIAIAARALADSLSPTSSNPGSAAP